MDNRIHELNSLIVSGVNFTAFFVLFFFMWPIARRSAPEL